MSNDNQDERYGNFKLEQIGATRNFDEADRYVVSFVAAYEHGDAPDDGYCGSPREAAEEAWSLTKEGFPVFVYDRLTKEMHRFECWGQETEGNGPSEGSVACYYVAGHGDDGRLSAFYRADGRLVPEETAWQEYETLARFQTATEAHRFCEALRACGKQATAINLRRAGGLAANPQA